MCTVKKVIGYVRVSTNEQAESGLSLDWQEQVIAAEISKRGLMQVEMIRDEGKSAKNLKRPGIQKALQMLKDGEANVLMVAKLDRVSRSVADFTGLIEKSKNEGWQLVILDMGIDTTTPTGELIANMMVSVSQWERRIIGERTKAALGVLKQQGKQMGRPVTVQAGTVAYINSLAANGLSIRKIAQRLNEEQVPSATGRTWHPTSVQRVMA